MARTTFRPLPPEVRAKLAKLLPLLSSGHGGECAAAAAAVDRVLKAAGLDWHDFTGAVTGAVPPPPSPPEPEPEPASYSYGPSYDDGRSADAKDVADTVNSIRAKRRFGENAEQFLDDLLERAAQYDVVYFSPKQWNFLRSLARQAGVNGSAASA